MDHNWHQITGTTYAMWLPDVGVIVRDERRRNASSVGNDPGGFASALVFVPGARLEEDGERVRIRPA